MKARSFICRSEYAMLYFLVFGLHAFTMKLPVAQLLIWCSLFTPFLLGSPPFPGVPYSFCFGMWNSIWTLTSVLFSWRHWQRISGCSP